MTSEFRLILIEPLSGKSGEPVKSKPHQRKGPVGGYGVMVWTGIYVKWLASSKDINPTDAWEANYMSPASRKDHSEAPKWSFSGVGHSGAPKCSFSGVELVDHTTLPPLTGDRFINEIAEQQIVTRAYKALNI